jgi:hypothetical protein
MSTSDFYEEQTFTQKWLVLIQYFILLLTLALSLAAIMTHRARPLPGALPFIAACLFILFFRSIKLQTKITDEGIYYRFLPFHLRYRTIRKTDIAGIRVTVYHPLRDYGGWGIRYGKNGKAFTIKGDKGIFILLNTKRSLLIGTSQPLEVEKRLKEHRYNTAESMF